MVTISYKINYTLKTLISQVDGLGEQISSTREDIRINTELLKQLIADVKILTNKHNIENIIDPEKEVVILDEELTKFKKNKLKRLTN